MTIICIYIYGRQCEQTCGSRYPPHAFIHCCRLFASFNNSYCTFIYNFLQKYTRLWCMYCMLLHSCIRIYGASSVCLRSLLCILFHLCIFFCVCVLLLLLLFIVFVCAACWQDQTITITLTKVENTLKCAEKCIWGNENVQFNWIGLMSRLIDIFIEWERCMHYYYRCLCIVACRELFESTHRYVRVMLRLACSKPLLLSLTYKHRERKSETRNAFVLCLCNYSCKCI